MLDKTHFRIPASINEKLDNLAPESIKCASDPALPDKRMIEVEKRLALFEKVLFDCAMTLKDKVADRLDHLEDLCHHETALLRQEFQQEDHDRKKELSLLTLKISEAIDRIAAEKVRQPLPASKLSAQEKSERFPNLNGLRPSKN